MNHIMFYEKSIHVLIFGFFHRQMIFMSHMVKCPEHILRNINFQQFLIGRSIQKIYPLFSRAEGGKNM